MPLSSLRLTPSIVKPWHSLRAGLVGLAAFGLLAGGAAAGDETGLVDDFAYESPTYGYAVEWDRPWEANLDETGADDGIDTLVLDTFGGFVHVAGFPTAFTPEEIVEDWAENISEDLIADPDVVAMDDLNGVSYAVIEDEAEDASFTIYVEARELAMSEDGEASLVALTLLFSSPETFENNAVSAAAEIELDGEPLVVAFAGDAAADADDDRRPGEDDEARISPNDYADDRNRDDADDENGRDSEDEDADDDEE